jgi:hypothetical protein
MEDTFDGSLEQLSQASGHREATPSD